MTISTLPQVAKAVNNKEFTRFMKEFIDSLISFAAAQGFSFNTNLPLAENVLAEPGDTHSPFAFAYLCAMAEHLAGMAGVPAPEWSQKAQGFLDHPVFIGGAHSREHLLKDTPPAFRRRLIFPGRVLIKLETLRRY